MTAYERPGHDRFQARARERDEDVDEPRFACRCPRLSGAQWRALRLLAVVLFAACNSERERRMDDSAEETPSEPGEERRDAGAVSANGGTPDGSRSTPGMRPDGALADAAPNTAGDTRAPSGSSDGSPANTGDARAGHTWTTYGFDLKNSQTNPYETVLDTSNVAQLEEKWRIRVPGGASSTPVIYDGTVYFGSWDGRFYAADAATGELRWQRTLSSMFVRSSALVTQDRVYVPAYRGLFALDRATGAVLFETVLDNEQLAIIDSSPKLIDGLILIGMASAENTTIKEDYAFIGSISALDAQTGDVVWRIETTGTDPGRCTGGAGVGVWTSAAFDPELGLAYFGTGENYEEPAGNCADALMAIHYARDWPGERIAWVAQYTAEDVYLAYLPFGSSAIVGGLDADVSGSPNLFEAGGKRLVGAGDKGGSYRVFDRQTGDLVWRADLDHGEDVTIGGVMTTAAVQGDTIYVASNRWVAAGIVNFATHNPEDISTLYALDTATGKERWHVELPSPTFGSFAIANGVLYFGIVNGVFYARELATGRELWKTELKGMFGVGPTVVDGRVYVSNGAYIMPNPNLPEGGLVASFGLPEGASTPATVIDVGAGEPPMPFTVEECQAVLAENSSPPSEACSQCLCECNATAWGSCPFCWGLSICPVLLCSLDEPADALRSCLADFCVGKLIPPGQFDREVEAVPCISTCAETCY